MARLKPRKFIPPEMCPVCGAEELFSVPTSFWHTRECQSCYYSWMFTSGEVTEHIALLTLTTYSLDSPEDVITWTADRDVALKEARSLFLEPTTQAYLETLRKQDPNIIEVYAQYADFLQENEDRFPLNYKVAQVEILEYEKRRRIGTPEERPGDRAEKTADGDAPPLPDPDEEVG